jgi:KipI family sensor histidine kinase inhibitor
VIRALAAGDAAVLLELATARAAEAGTEPAVSAGTAARLAAAVRSAGLPGVVDVVPGAQTVLVTVEPGSFAGPDALARTLLGVPFTAGPDAGTGPVTEVDVCYDGEDLAEVARLTGLTEGEVIARHQAAEYVVGWLGFSPGFGYLTGLDDALSQVPRLDRPRVSVPAGSVAIAGGLAAVYPAPSPGGWRLLGRTSARLWDPERQPPALLAPGMRVRFRAAPELPEPVVATSSPPARPLADQGPAWPVPRRGVEILQPGPLTTVQDLGRSGLGHLGVPGSGAADAVSLRHANALVGNEPGAACLEVTMGRLALRFAAGAVAALAGAPAPLQLAEAAGVQQEPRSGQAFEVPAGAVLRLGPPTTGLRSYLAVDGGIDVAPVLGSRSSDLLSGLGPPPLRAGDWLPLGPVNEAGSGPAPDGPWPASDPEAGTELRLIAGPRADWFGAAGLAALTAGRYEVSAASNRTGLRLAGPALRRVRPGELPSEGIATGSLQVTHDGQPILLLADHPTTGGYPVIAVVRAADIGRAAQLRPGQRVRFTLADAS